MRKITIQEMAGMLGLSRNTVAKALNDDASVAPETRAEVIRLAKEVGYTKLSLGIEEKYGKLGENGEKRNVLLVSKKENASFWNKIIIGITDRLGEEGCRLLFNFIGEKEENEGILPADLEEDTAGVIVLSVLKEDYIRQLGKRVIPMVFLDASSPGLTERSFGDVLLFEGRAPVYHMTLELLKRGRKRPAFIGDITYCVTIHDRYLGFLDALREEGIRPEEAVMITDHVPGRYYRREEVENAMEDREMRPDLIVCGNDVIAKYVLLYLKRQDIRVPQDVWVTGFDNTSSNAYMDISLTTVNVEKEYMGRRLARQILWRMEEEKRPGELVHVAAEPVYGDTAPIAGAAESPAFAEAE